MISIKYNGITSQNTDPLKKLQEKHARYRYIPNGIYKTKCVGLESYLKFVHSKIIIKTQLW
jgi:hypothetical protein